MSTIQLALIVISLVLVGMNVLLLIYISFKAYKIGDLVIKFVTNNNLTHLIPGLNNSSDCIDGLQALLEARLVYESTVKRPGSLTTFETLDSAMASIIYEINSLEMVQSEGKFYLIETKRKTPSDIMGTNVEIFFEQKTHFSERTFKPAPGN